MTQRSCYWLAYSLSQRHLVWRVIRRVSFDSGKEMLPENLLATLREKYGHESLPLGQTPFGATWFFDAQGRPAVELGGLRFNNCSFLATTSDLDASIDNHDGAI